MSMTEAELSAKISEELEASADEILGGEGTNDVTPEEENKDGLQEEKPSSEASEEVKSESEQDEAFAKSGEDPDAAKEEDKAEGSEEKSKEKSEDKKEDEPAKEEDEGDYDIPEDVKGRTRERMEGFVSKLKEKDEKLAQKDEMLGAFKTMLDETGLSNQELSRVMDIGSMMKYEPEKAYEVLNGVVKGLAQRLGKEHEGVDLLAGHDDLKQAVDALQITPEAARELAAARNNQKRLEQNQSQERQQREQARDSEARVETAKKDVAGYLKSIEGDIDFQAIAPHMLDAAKFAGQNLAPEKWMEYLKGEYGRIKAVAGQAKPKRDTQPIVEDSGSKGGDKAPSTLEELADQML